MSKVTYRGLERDRDHWRERAMAAEEEVDFVLAALDNAERELEGTHAALIEAEWRIRGLEK